MAHRVIPPDDPKFPAIRKQVLINWLKTLTGYLGMGLLIFLALWAFDFTYRFQLGFGLVWFILPVVMWWFSAKVALMMTKSKPADPNNPQHARLIKIVDRVWAESGLKFKPPVYVSENPLPNAFATGPIHRKAVVAATEGLFLTGMNDDEIAAVFAHELGHVKNYDVGFNSFLSILSMIFFMITDAGVRMVMGSISIFKRILGMNPKNRGFFTGILEWVIMMVIFRITGMLTRIVQMFVVRSRESGADATGALILGKPCDLATALQKLVAYVEKNRPKGRDRELYRAIRPMMTIDPLFDSMVEDKPANLWQRLVRFWKYLQLTHPPVPERVAMLERMNGGSCPAPQFAGTGEDEDHSAPDHVCSCGGGHHHSH
ncbi:MAG: M48 family metalloprotease [Cyanobacteria bacterium HKST-UBA02]|nr:M48 family metalloprotease [Cyanobacteria bacterium HKST-UBA02]